MKWYCQRKKLKLHEGQRIRRLLPKAKQLMHRRSTFNEKGAAQADRRFFKKRSFLKTTCQKDSCGLSFEFFFFSSILEQNGHAIRLPLFVSFGYVEIGLQLCNSKQLQAYRFSRN